MFLWGADFLYTWKLLNKDFYMPQVEAQEDFLRKYPGNRAAEELIVDAI